jgi:hypothetical protein
MLLFLMIAVAVMTIVMLGVARNYRRGIIRDREVEMMHRGDQYARAVKRYFKKNGAYPNSIEQLEKTNNIRYLRKRYKDPMSPDGAWKLVHPTDITLRAGGGLVPSVTGTQTGLGAAGGSAFGQSSFGNTGSNTSGANQGIGGAAGATGTVTGTGTSGVATTGTDTSGAATPGTNPPFPGATTAGTTPPEPSGSTTDTAGTTATGTTSATSNSFGSTATSGAGLGNNAAAGGQVLGGGPVLGVVSKMKSEGIHSFGEKTKYNEWFFIYDPSQDKGQLLVGPYNPKMFLGATTGTGLGTNPSPATAPGNTPASGFSLSNQPSAPVAPTPSAPAQSPPTQ